MGTTRLELLCKLHDVQGGTIHEYNRMYGVDILSLSEVQWERLYAAISSMMRTKQIEYFKLIMQGAI